MQINTSSTGVTTNVNAAGTLTKIFECETPDGLEYLYPDGALLVMKLHDVADAEIDGDSKIVIAAKQPIDNFPAESLDEKTYRPFAIKDLDDQMDSDKNRLMKIRIDDGGIRVPELNTFEIWLESADLIVWANCTLEINDVKKKNM